MTDTTQQYRGPPALANCPFCGGPARFLKRAIGIKGTMSQDWWHSIQCARCNAAVGYDDNRYRDKADALKAWNTRATDAEITRLKDRVDALTAALEDLLSHFPAERMFSEKETHGTILFEWSDVEKARAAIARATTPDPAPEYKPFGDLEMLDNRGRRTGVMNNGKPIAKPDPAPESGEGW